MLAAVAVPVDPLELAIRTAWPEELLVHYRLHPRPWQLHTLPDIANHWLGVHNMFRQHATLLAAATDAWSGKTLPALNYLRTAVPRAASFVHVLHMHHHAETDMAFPAVAVAAPEMARAFAVLDRDHAQIEPMLERVERVIETRDPRIDPMASELAAALPPLLAALDRHLNDEEDIIVPALVVRGHLVRGL
jgi:iron-sulfur cluster repair protein YtfE (RIC family)